jgi:hypothetical protein
MLRQLTGAPVCGSDGEAGSIVTVLVDGVRRRIPYLVVSAGRRTVLVAASSLGRFDWAFAVGALRVDLTRAGVAASPPFDPARVRPLVRADEMAGGIVRAVDGEAGHVEDLLIDDVAWAVRFLQVGIGDRSVLVPSAWIDRLDEDGRAVTLVVDCGQIRAAPPFAGTASPGPNLG